MGSVRQDVSSEDDRIKKCDYDAEIQSKTKLYRRYKTLMIGKTWVGKSWLYQSSRRDFPSPPMVMGSTHGVNERNLERTMDGIVVQWFHVDSADPAVWRVGAQYYRNTHAVIAVYDITRRDTFDQLPHLFQDFDHQRGGVRGEVLRFIIGNKCDLTNEREVPYQVAWDYANSIGAGLFETSAKYDINVELAFHTVLAHLMEADRKGMLNFTEYR